jgi:hypothetical protein
MGCSLDGANPSPSRLAPAFRRKFGESPPARLLHAGGLAGSVSAIFRIRLGWKWIDADRREKIQTFIHEASHIAGRTVAHENLWYGESSAQAMAATRRPLRPRMMMRSADNLGYYAIDLADNFLEYI